MFLNGGLRLNYYDAAIDFASSNGHIHVLEWWALNNRVRDCSGQPAHGFDATHQSLGTRWKASGLDLKYSNIAMNFAAANGHIHILKWWKTSGLDLKYSYVAINFAFYNAQVASLDWWWNSGLKFSYTPFKINRWASKINHSNVYNWWKENGLHF